MKKFRTNYSVAVNWLGNNYVLCNNITEDQSIFDNARFSPYYLEDVDGNRYADENEVPEGVEIANEVENEIFQYFITDCTKEQVEYLENHFGLLFTYSDALDLYILCVDHFGTSWDYVMIDTDLENAARKEGERK